jgi:hypothetical protein
MIMVDFRISNPLGWVSGLQVVDGRGPEGARQGADLVRCRPVRGQRQVLIGLSVPVMETAAAGYGMRASFVRGGSITWSHKGVPRDVGRLQEKTSRGSRAAPPSLCKLPEVGDYPVDNVNFAEAEAFCAKLTETCGTSKELTEFRLVGSVEND